MSKCVNAFCGSLRELHQEAIGSLRRLPGTYRSCGTSYSWAEVQIGGDVHVAIIDSPDYAMHQLRIIPHLALEELYLHYYLPNDVYLSIIDAITHLCRTDGALLQVCKDPSFGTAI
jgi:hypothetical protein